MSSSEKPLTRAFLKPERRACLIIALVCVACPFFEATAGASLTNSENPYKVIFHRNLFKLRAPSPPAPAAPPPAPSSKIILTGITTILGQKRAFLEITPPPKPPMPAKEVSCVLTEGAREAGVEVIQIDPNAGAVKVSENGTVATLTFEKNGRKATPTPAPVKTLPQFQRVRLPIQVKRR